MNLQPINLLYISISGNTRSFIKRLVDYSKSQHEQDPSQPVIAAVEVSEETPFYELTEPFTAMVPTYLDGGNGIDNGVKELMTNSLGELIAFKDNRHFLNGVIGSGNKNFNDQYCLTAKRYANNYNAPLIADYELRGNDHDLKRVYQSLVENSQKA